MKVILATQTMDIPDNVKVEIKAKQIRVTGPQGVLTRNFKHLNLDFQMIEAGKKLKVDAWFGSRKTIAAIRTAISHVNNLITGITKGYRFSSCFEAEPKDSHSGEVEDLGFFLSSSGEFARVFFPV